MPTQKQAQDAVGILEAYVLEQQVKLLAPSAPPVPEFLFKIGYVNLYRVGAAIVFCSGMMIDADGSPHAYHPSSSKGLDALANAGHPGNWWGIATSNGRTSGTPILQGANDPAPGFYVSTTALENPAFNPTDQNRYINASSVPFIVLPSGLGMGLKLGDLCLCYNEVTGDNEFGIYADIGPSHQIGEASIAMAQALKVPSSARTGGTAGGIWYVVFPGSGEGYQPEKEWFGAAGAEFAAWGGLAVLKGLIDQELV